MPLAGRGPPLLGDRLAVGLRTLTPSTLVRIQVPQPLPTTPCSSTRRSDPQGDQGPEPRHGVALGAAAEARTRAGKELATMAGVHTRPAWGLPERGQASNKWGKMPTFKVICYDNGVWDRKDEREVIAETGEAAAKKVCGGGLILLGKLGSLRAQVYLSSEPKFKLRVYAPPGS